MPLLGIDHVELYVGNARQSAWTFERLGFQIEAYAGLETGARDRASWYLRQGEVRLVFTGALDPASPIAEHVRVHGDGVRSVAFTVPDAGAAFDTAVLAGAVPLTEPTGAGDRHGDVVSSEVAGYGDVSHVFVERHGYRGPFLPGFHRWAARPAAPPATAVGITRIDHIVAAVPVEDADRVVDFYRHVLGFRMLQYFDDTQIATERSALMNKVMADGTGRIKIPVVEPGRGSQRGQIHEFLDYHRGPGVQHIALEVTDIVAAVAELRRRGLEFLTTPDTYYTELAARVPAVADRVAALQGQHILADVDDEGHLLQIFAKSMNDRPTMFVELIERHGAVGFGEGNVRALYEALEREQQARGNL